MWVCLLWVFVIFYFFPPLHNCLCERQEESLCIISHAWGFLLTWGKLNTLWKKIINAQKSQLFHSRLEQKATATLVALWVGTITIHSRTKRYHSSGSSHYQPPWYSSEQPQTISGGRERRFICLILLFVLTPDNSTLPFGQMSHKEQEIIPLILFWKVVPHAKSCSMVPFFFIIYHGCHCGSLIKHCVQFTPGINF